MLEGHVKPAELADLTPRQINDIYGHARDDQGRVKFPVGAAPAPADERTSVLQVLSVASMMGAPPEQIEMLRRRLAEIDGVPYVPPEPALNGPGPGNHPFPVQFVTAGGADGHQ